MIRNWCLGGLVVSVFLLSSSLLSAQDKSSTEKPAAEETKKETEAKQSEETKSTDKKDEEKPKSNELKLTGVFVSEEVTEIILRPEAWTTLKVQDAVKHGTQVGAGDELLQLETEDIDRKIEDLRRSQFAASLALKLAEQELAFAKETYPTDRKISERTLQHTKDDLEYYLSVTLPNSKESTARSLQNSKYRLEYVTEELEQLTKMYKEDDLTEETEEIILLRAQRDVAEMQQFVERAEERTEHTLTIGLPRQKETTVETAEKTVLTTQKALAAQEINLRRKQHDHEQQVIVFERADQNLQELVKDRTLLSVKSPAEGLVYYGQATRGKWAQVATLEKSLRPSGSVTANSVIMSIVNPENLTLVVDVPEAKLKDFSVGTKGQVVPKAFPDLKIPAEVTHISLVPISPGIFDGQITLKLKKRPARLVPGMGADFLVDLKSNKKE